MTDTPLYTRRNVPAYIAIACVLIAGLWSIIWYYAAGHAEQRLARLIEKQGSKGTHIECEDKQTGGFPFRYELFCSHLVISSASSAQGARTLSLEHVHAVTQVISPNHWIVEATGKARLHEGAQNLVDADADLYQASLRQVQDGVNIAIVGTNVNEHVWHLPKLDSIELHSRPVNGIEGGLELAITGNGIQSTVFNAKAPFEFSTLLQGNFSKVLNSNLKQEDFATWAKTSGAIDVKQFVIRYDQFISHSTGVLQMSETGQLTGTLNAHIEEQATADGQPKKKSLFPSPQLLILMTMGISKLPADMPLILREDSTQIGTLKLPALPAMW